MRLVDGVAVFSPSELTGYLACDHLLTLELRAMAGELARPERDDPELAVLARRGLAHEERYLAQRRAEGRSVTVIGAERGDLASSGLARLRELNDRTVAALRAGPDVIYQGAFFDGRWQGFADFLLRVETPSDLGAYSYEVADTNVVRRAMAARSSSPVPSPRSRGMVKSGRPCRRATRGFRAPALGIRAEEP